MRDKLKEVKEIFDKLAKLKGISSTNSKKTFIKANKDDKLFLDTLEFLLNDDKITNISKKKIEKKVNVAPDRHIYDLNTLFTYLVQECTGKDSNIASVQWFINEHEEFKDELKELVTKSIRLGVKAKLVNDALGYALVHEFNIMLAESYSKEKDKIKDGTEFILTTKLDGSRIIAIREHNRITFKTRQNKLYEQLVDLEKEFENLPCGVYDGELLATGEFENSAEQYKETMKRSRKKGIKHGLKMVCYDYIENIDDFYNGLDKTKCINRKNKLKEILSSNNEFVEYLDPLYIGTNKDKISEFSKNAVDNGDEGIMLSIADSPYECKRSKKLLKVKEFITVDCLVVDIFKGEGKYDKTLGGLVCEFMYKGKRCRTEVGSGFSDKERDTIYNNPKLVMNKIITIKAFEISQNSSTGEYSCRFPVWLGMDYIRDDKVDINDTNVG